MLSKLFPIHNPLMGHKIGLVGCSQPFFPKEKQKILELTTYTTSNYSFVIHLIQLFIYMYNRLWCKLYLFIMKVSPKKATKRL